MLQNSALHADMPLSAADEAVFLALVQAYIEQLKGMGGEVLGIATYV